MKNTYGNSVAITIFGESHGAYIGAVLDGMAPGIDVDEEYINHMLFLRRPDGKISTPRKEKDGFQIISGVVSGKTTGTPITILIPNENVKSGDYADMRSVARPSHADYTAECKYHGFQDSRGGGHFSGRITAALVAAGAICKYALEQKGILLGTHIKSCAGILDRDFENLAEDIGLLNDKTFAVLNDCYIDEMTNAILTAAKEGDSVGGILETAIIGMPQGVGEPWFDSMESQLSHMMFSIPAVKGIEFGSGFACAAMTGSQCNDSFRTDGEKIFTETNHSGGIQGGMTNGMPLIFRAAIKPTPSIAKKQNSVSLSKMENAILQIHGRHDPCIGLRAVPVLEAVLAIALMDTILDQEEQ